MVVNNKHSNYVAIRKENEGKYGSDIGRIGKMLLADRYSDRTHFIFELLQNAEDALGKRSKDIGTTNSINFQLAESALSISHYGKPFDENDVRGICGIAESTKNQITAIGRFGIGFKSVYSFTDRPEIHSGDEHFVIENYVWPKETSQVELKNNETRIVLPLFEKTKQEDYNEILEGLKKINLISLLFLHNIEEIEWSTSNGESGLFVRGKPQKLDNNVKTVELIGQSNEGNDVSEKWLVFSKEISNKKDKGIVEIAFLFNDDKIRPVKHSPLVVFFPTVVTTQLGFLVQGSYRTTPSRDNIPTKDNWNQYCISKTNELVVESLLWLRNKKWLNVETLRCFPINRDIFPEETMFYSLFEVLKANFTKEALLPCYENGYVSAEDALLARTKDLRELFSYEKISNLYGKDYKWLSVDITQDLAPDLRKYMITELGITEVQPETVIGKLTSEFLGTQSNLWLRSFYEFLNKQKSLHEKIKSMPIIRCSDSQMVVPFKNGKETVFLPGKVTEFPTVHTDVCNSKDSKSFLIAIGLTEPTQIDDVIINILPKFDNPENSLTKEIYMQIMERILLAYNVDSVSQKERLVGELKSRKFVAVIDAVSGKEYYEKPNRAYFNTDNFKKLFSGIPDVYFVNEQYGLKGEKYRALLESCGVARNLRLIEKQNGFTSQELERMRKTAGSVDSSWNRIENDNTLCGLEELIDNISHFTLNEKKEKIELLWKELHNLHERKRDAAFIGTYTWGYFQRSHSCNFDTYFIRFLNRAKWVLDENGDLQKPEDIYFSKLGWGNYEFLLSKIHFKSDEIQAFEEKTGYKAVPADEYEQFKQWQENQKNNTNEDIKQEKEFEPAVSSADASLKVISFNDIDQSTPFDTSQTNKSNITYDVVSNSDNEFNNIERSQNDKYEKDSEIDKNYLKQEGRWGELFVLKLLKEEYKNNTNIEIVDLNESGKTGIGADFVIKNIKNDEILKLVEVKTTKEARGNGVQVSGRQWETARHYFKVDNGDIYWIYCVFNAGKNNAEIVPVQNPIKKWKDGVLLADPINFIIV